MTTWSGMTAEAAKAPHQTAAGLSHASGTASSADLTAGQRAQGKGAWSTYIANLPADLNLEDDKGRNIARLGDAVAQDTVTPGAVLVAGAPRAWSWAVVEDVDGGFVYFQQISAQDAARRGPLVKPLPQSA
jgi:hypothetical protein